MTRTMYELTPQETITRVRVLVGEDADAERRGGKTVIAHSDARYYCRDAAMVERCVSAIRASDEWLRNRPAERMEWDWQSTYFEADPASTEGGGTILLGVAWYTMDYYHRHKNAWFGDDHERIYARIGVPLGEVQVTHWLLDEAVSETV